jgi:hypothetical protein
LDNSFAWIWKIDGLGLDVKILYKTSLAIKAMAGGHYLNLRLVYIGKTGDIKFSDILMHSELPNDSYENIARLDIAAGIALSEIRKRKSFPRMLGKFAGKIRKNGFLLVGKVVDKGTAGKENFVDAWVPDSASLPQAVDAIPYDPPGAGNPPKELYGVYGGYCRINIGTQRAVDTLTTHGYRYASGRFEITGSSPFSNIR